MGGSGDGGYAAKQDEIEAKKQEARDALNVLFGVRPTSRPSADAYRIPASQPGGVPMPGGGGTGVGEGASPGTSANGPGSPGDGPGGVDASRPRAAATTAPGTYTPPITGGYGGDESGGGGYVPPGTPPQPVGPQAGDLDRAAYAQAMEDYRAQVAASKENRQGRNALYRGVRDAAYSAGERELNEDRDQAARKLKFELFAQGLNGGSEDIDQNALFGRTYSKGVLDLGAKADAAKASFRGADESTRLNLLQSIDAGMDMGSALSAATNGMSVASDKATADAQGTTLGNLFDNAGLMYQYNQYSQGKQAGQQQGWNMFPGNTWNRSGGSNATTGVSTRTY